MPVVAKPPPPVDYAKLRKALLARDHPRVSPHVVLAHAIVGLHHAIRAYRTGRPLPPRRRGDKTHSLIMTLELAAFEAAEALADVVDEPEP